MLRICAGGGGGGGAAHGATTACTAGSGSAGACSEVEIKSPDLPALTYALGLLAPQELTIRPTPVAGRNGEDSTITIIRRAANPHCRSRGGDSEPNLMFNLVRATSAQQAFRAERGIPLRAAISDLR